MGFNAAIPTDLGFLGCWDLDAATGKIRTTGRLDELFAVCPDLSGAPIEAYEFRVHPDDIEWLRKERPRCFGPSGWGVIEYRMIDKTGQVHWVMCRALYETDDKGQISSAHGMMFDVSALKKDGMAVRTPPTPLPEPLYQAADALLTAHAAAIQSGDRTLVTQIEAALVTVGRSLAQTLLLGREMALSS